MSYAQGLFLGNCRCYNKHNMLGKSNKPKNSKLSGWQRKRDEKQLKVDVEGLEKELVPLLAKYNLVLSVSYNRYVAGNAPLTAHVSFARPNAPAEEGGKRRSKEVGEFRQRNKLEN